MYDKLNDLMIRLYVALKALERGDADSSGSTLRTAGIILLVVAVVMIIGGAVYALSGVIAGNITARGGSFPW